MRRRSVPWFLAIGALVLAVWLVGIFAADRALRVIGAGFLPDSAPSVADVLDGRVAELQRNEAISKVESKSALASLKGTTPVGTVVYTSCREGQNNFKVREGYRLRCMAHSALYLAWSGDPNKVFRRAVPELVGWCASSAQPMYEAMPRAGVNVDWFPRANGEVAALVYGTSNGLTPDSAELDYGHGTEDSRRISGPSSDVLFQELSTYDWFIIYKRESTYFEDQP